MVRLLFSKVCSFILIMPLCLLSIKGALGGPSIGNSATRPYTLFGLLEQWRHIQSSGKANSLFYKNEKNDFLSKLESFSVLQNPGRNKG